jgi:hypothetical protein
MEQLTIDNDLKVFGIEVKTFPAGIDEAFRELIRKTGDLPGARNYYGVSSMKDARIIYKAVAEQKFNDEAEKLNFEKSIIEKGAYLFTTLKNWRTQTNCIKDIFHEMMNNDRTDKTKPCVEWYKNDEEMLCLVKAI